MSLASLCTPSYLLSFLMTNSILLHQGLEEGKKYRFRVRAENMYGVSDPLDGSGPVEAKNPFDAPDSPEKPEIEGYSPSSCQLVWKPPANNGGRPVTGYIIEKRDRGGDWIRVSVIILHVLED